MTKKKGDLTGYSNEDLHSAITQALAQTDESLRVEVVETRSLSNGELRQYQVTLATFKE